MIQRKLTMTRPDPSVSWWRPDAQSNYLRNQFHAEGKILSTTEEPVSPLVTIVTVIYRDQAAFDEWRSTRGIYRQARLDYLAANNITELEEVSEITVP